MAYRCSLQERQRENEVSYWYDVTEYVSKLFGEGIIKSAWCYVGEIDNKECKKEKTRVKLIENIHNHCEGIDISVDENQGVYCFNSDEMLEITFVNDKVVYFDCWGSGYTNYAAHVEISSDDE